MRYLLGVFVLMLLCPGLGAQDKKQLKSWDVTDAKNADQKKVVTFLKKREIEKEELLKEDSVKGQKVTMESSFDWDAYYQRVERRMAEKAKKDSLLLLHRPPVPQYDKPPIVDSITGQIKPRILEAYWMNEYGERITTICANEVGYLFVRTQAYPIGSEIKVTLTKSSGKKYQSGEEALNRVIYSDEDGIAILANNIWY